MYLKSLRPSRCRELTIRLLTVVALMGTETTLFGFEIFNSTNTPMMVDVSAPGNIFFSETVPAQGGWTCDANSTNLCNPDQNCLATYNLQVRTLNANGRDFEVFMPMQATSNIRIREYAHPWGGGGVQYQVEVYQGNIGTFGNCSELGQGPSIAERPFGLPWEDHAVRSVDFLAMGDPQFNQNWGLPFGQDPNSSGGNGTAYDALTTLLDMGDANFAFRGAIISGDLTHSRQAEVDVYKDVISRRSNFIFDGLGNHDYDLSFDLGGCCDDPLDINECCIERIVAERRHNTAKSKTGSNLGSEPWGRPHYSWDWHDLHFVQLNLMCSDTPGIRFVDAKQRAALSFMNDDLATHVGNSGRPVIVIQHYDFDYQDGDGVEPWSQAQRVDMYNALSGYNVAAILVGHQHKSPNSGNRAFRFHPDLTNGIDGDDAAVPDEDKIFTYNVAAGRKGAIVELKLNGANQMRIRVFDETGVTDASYDSRIEDFHAPIYLAPSSGLELGWESAPYTNVADAMTQLSDVFPNSTPAQTDVIFESATYSFSGTLDRTSVLKSANGQSTIGS